MLIKQLSSFGIFNALVPSSAYDALQGVRFRFPCKTAYALAGYAHFCAACLGFFSCHHYLQYLMVLNKKLISAPQGSRQYIIMFSENRRQGCGV